MGACMGTQKVKMQDLSKLSFDNMKLCEEEVLKLMNIPKENIINANIHVKDFDGAPVYINTNICGDLNKPFLVLVHGYGSAGPLYFKIIKKLTEHFCVILMDMVGMGASSRPKDYNKKTITPQQSIDYFVEYMELWRVAMGKYLAEKTVIADFT